MPKINHPDKTQGHERSGKWAKVRRDFLKKNPRCVICNGTKKLEVHHVIPFSHDSTLELNEENLIVLCEEKPHFCHLNIGHLGNFHYYNPNILEDSKMLNEKIQNRLKINDGYTAK